jgi:hypothetical protein
VDPELIGVITATVTAAATEIGTEAGRQAWESLVQLVRRETVGADVVDLPPAPDSREVDELVKQLSEAAAGNPRFAADLADWARAVKVEPGAEPATTVTVKIGGYSRVGTVITARTVNGSINL